MPLSTNEQFVAPDEEYFSLATCFHEITATLSEGVIVYDAAAAPLHINASAARILGMTAEEIRSHLTAGDFWNGTWQFIGERGQRIDPAQSLITTCLRTGQPSTGVVLGIDRTSSGDAARTTEDQTIQWLSVNLRPLHDASGAIQGAVSAFTDITARKQAEARLSKEQNFSDLAINNLPGVFYLIDASERFVRWSSNLEDLTGYTAKDMRDAHPTDLIAPDDRATVAARIRDVFDTGYATTDAMLVAKGGAHIPYLFTGARVEIQGAPHLVGMGLDITERKQYEHKLMTAQHRAEVSQREAEEMGRLKAAFLANMSHELRTPLTSIIGFADLLMSDLPDAFKDYASYIRQGATRLMCTIGSVMELAHLESQSVTPCSHRFDLVDDLREIAKAMRPKAEDQGLTLTLDIPDAPVWLQTDRGAVDRIISSLLSNAIKFTAEGSIALHLSDTRDGVLLRVEDTGVGIAPEFMPHIFDEFRQESMGMSRSYEGNGLGLAIAKRLVDLLGGSISATSHPETGSVFSVFLPHTQQEDPSPSDLAAAAPAEAHTPTAEPPTRLKSDATDERPYVLVVEDHAETQAIVKHLLRPLCRVLVASDAEEAIRQAEAHAIALAFIDINLSCSQSGLDVLHALKSLPHLSRTHLIALTAYAMPGDRERFLGLGFDQYISKPFRKDELLSVVKDVLHTTPA